MSEDITELFAYVAEDGAGPGKEGIVSTLNLESKTWVPMVSSRRDTMDRMRAQAEEVVRATGRTLRLVRFSRRNQLAILRPKTGAETAEKAPEPERVAPAPPHMSLPYSNFSQPIVQTEGLVHADGVIVFADISDGEPGIAISYLVNGEQLPAIVVKGTVASDLVGLVADALKAAGRTQN